MKDGIAHAHKQNDDNNTDEIRYEMISLRIEKTRFYFFRPHLGILSCRSNKIIDTTICM